MRLVVLGDVVHDELAIQGEACLLENICETSVAEYLTSDCIVCVRGLIYKVDQLVGETLGHVEQLQMLHDLGLALQQLHKQHASDIFLRVVCKTRCFHVLFHLAQLSLQVYLQQADVGIVRVRLVEQCVVLQIRVSRVNLKQLLQFVGHKAKDVHSLLRVAAEVVGRALRYRLDQGASLAHQDWYVLRELSGV